MKGEPARNIAIGSASRQNLLAGALGAAFFLIPLYPAFITLTRATVPGISLLPRPLAIGLLALAAAIAMYFIVLLLLSPKQPMPTLLPVAALPGAALIAALLGFDPLAGALFIAILAGGVIWHATILRFAREPAVLSTILGAYLASGALASLVAIVLVLTKVPAAQYTIGHGRAIGTFVLPGELAGYLMVFVPVAYALARTLPRLRPLAYAGLVLGAAAFVLTFSRAGWIGMAAALSALVLMQRRGGGTRYAIAIMGAALVIVLYAFNVHHDPSENFTRLTIWETSLRMIGRFPFSGVGPFDFDRIYPFVRVPGGEPIAYHAHSVVLTIAAETGFVGVAALLFGWWRFVMALRARMRLDSAYGRVAAAIAAGLIGTWVQGLIDTISIVVFGLWLPFMALALVSAGNEPSAPVVTPAGTRNAWPRRALIGAAAVAAVCCAFIQVASSEVYSAAASLLSFPAHLPQGAGTRMYEALERIAPAPFVETALVDDALLRHDLPGAARRVARIPRGPVRSDFEGQIALARGRTNAAVDHFMAAGDDEALQLIVDQWFDDGRVDDAYRTEREIRDRLAKTATRPNALAESWWRLGIIAIEIPADAGEVAPDIDHAVALAPLNTKYLLGAGLIALHQKRSEDATRHFTRAHELDPTDADAIAGLGLVALQRKDPHTASQLLARAEATDDCAPLVFQMEEILSDRSINDPRSKSGRLCPDEHDPFNLTHHPISL